MLPNEDRNNVAMLLKSMTYEQREDFYKSNACAEMINKSMEIVKREDAIKKSVAAKMAQKVAQDNMKKSVSYEDIVKSSAIILDDYINRVEAMEKSQKSNELRKSQGTAEDFTYEDLVKSSIVILDDFVKRSEATENK